MVDTGFESGEGKDIFGQEVDSQTTLLFKGAAHAGIFAAGVSLFLKVIGRLCEL